MSECSKAHQAMQVMVNVQLAMVSRAVRKFKSSFVHFEKLVFADSQIDVLYQIMPSFIKCLHRVISINKCIARAIGQSGAETLTG